MEASVLGIVVVDDDNVLGVDVGVAARRTKKMHWFKEFSCMHALTPVIFSCCSDRHTYSLKCFCETVRCQ